MEKSKGAIVIVMILSWARTVKVTVAECLIPPPVPVIVTVNVPEGVYSFVVTVSVDEKGGSPELLLNEYKTPCTCPEALRLTGWTKPVTNVVLTV